MSCTPDNQFQTTDVLSQDLVDQICANEFPRICCDAWVPVRGTFGTCRVALTMSVDRGNLGCKNRKLNDAENLARVDF